MFDEVLQEAASRGLHIVVAESLTGGMLASAIVDVPGASNVFLGGVIAYQDSVKQAELGVLASTLESHGAVSAVTASEMAIGVCMKYSVITGVPSEALIGIATTGVAGPDPDGDHPVGEVFVAISMGGKVLVRELSLSGSRSEIRRATVSAVSGLLLSMFS